MQHTTNFNLNLPEGYDQFDITHFNQNTNTIDAKLKELQNVTDTVTNEEKKLTAALAQGATQLQFTDPAITSSAYIDVYTSVYGVNPKSMEVTGNTCTLKFEAQLAAVDVALVIKTWRTV